MNSRILVTSILAVTLIFLPAFTLAQQPVPVADAQGKIPNFYNINGVLHWCTTEANARKIAKDSNDLLFCRSENEKLLARILEKDGIISSYEQIIANNAIIQAAQSKQIKEHEEVRRNLDESVKALKNDSDLLKKENVELKDLARTKWYRSPFLWFGVGVAAAFGANYVWELQTGDGGDN